MEKVEAEKSANDGKQEKKAKLSVSIERADLFEEMLQIEGVKGFILTANAFWIFGCVNRFRRWHRDARGRKGALVHFPSLFRTKDQELWDQQMKQYMTCFDGMMVKNTEQIAYLEQIGYDGTWAADYNVYAYNKKTKSVLKKFWLQFFCLPCRAYVQRIERA